MAQKVLKDGWWRFDRYEVDSGHIRPAPGARLEQFDPWRQYAEMATGESEHEPPYVTLGHIAQQVKDLLSSPSRLDHEPHALQAVVDWCGRWGLLGVLLTGLHAVTPVVHWRTSGIAGGGDEPDCLVPVLTSYEWSGGGWRRSDVELTCEEPRGTAWPRGDEGDALPSRDLSEYADRLVQTCVPAPGFALRREHSLSLTGRSWRLERLGDGRWSSFFPDIGEDAHAYDYPRPTSEQFWRHYAEPLAEFAEAGTQLMRALDEIKQPAHEESAATLRRLLEHTTPDVESRTSGYVGSRWSSPSLESTFALMAYVDLTGGGRLDTCPACGNAFVVHRPGHTYCSSRCKGTASKRRQRARRRSRSQDGSAAPYGPA